MLLLHIFGEFTMNLNSSNDGDLHNLALENVPEHIHQPIRQLLPKLPVTARKVFTDLFKGAVLNRYEVADKFKTIKKDNKLAFSLLSLFLMDARHQKQLVERVAEALGKQAGELDDYIVDAWWAIAAEMGSEQGKLHQMYLALLKNDFTRAEEAAALCEEWLTHRGITRERPIEILAKAVAAELAIRDNNPRIARLLLQNTSPRELVNLQDDQLDKLQRMAIKAFDDNPAEPVPAGHIRVIRSITKSEDKREKDALARYSPLRLPIPLAPCPENTQWAQILKYEFPWMGEVIDHIKLSTTFRKNMGQSTLHFDPVCLVGSAGIGKSRFIKRLGEVLATPSRVLSLNGMADNMMLKGAGRGWGTSRPGILVDMMLQQKCPNPIIGLDEIDKVGESRNNGNVWDTLLGMLEPQTAQNIFDEFLLGEVDYSHINWIATANSIHHMPSVLLSRMRVIHVAPPQAKDFDAILQSVRNNIAKKHDAHPEMLPTMDNEVLMVLRRAFAKKRSVRALIRMTHQIMAEDATRRPQYLN
jgi:hypothetical protein